MGGLLSGGTRPAQGLARISFGASRVRCLFVTSFNGSCCGALLCLLPMLRLRMGILKIDPHYSSCVYGPTIYTANRMGYPNNPTQETSRTVVHILSRSSPTYSSHGIDFLSAVPMVYWRFKVVTTPISCMDFTRPRRCALAALGARVSYQ